MNPLVSVPFLQLWFAQSSLKLGCCVLCPHGRVHWTRSGELVGVSDTTVSPQRTPQSCFLPATSFLTLSRYFIPLASSSWSKLWLSKSCRLMNTDYEQMLCWSGVGVLQEEGLSNRLESLGVSFPPHSWSKHWPDWTQSQWGMGLLRLLCRQRIIMPCGQRSARDLEMTAIVSPFVFITYEQTLIKKILGGKALSFCNFFFFFTFSS